MFLEIGKFSKLHKKAPVLKSLFNKVGGLRASNFIQNRSSRLQMFFKIGALKNAANFTGFNKIY